MKKKEKAGKKPVQTPPVKTASPEKSSAFRERLGKAGSVLKKSAGAGVSALNGFFGDSLENKNLPLAIRMQFYMNDKPLEMTEANLKEKYPKLNSKICILVHGLLTKESMWNFPDNPAINYGSLLKNELGYTPFYLRYNSGLHISENGKNLSILIEKLNGIYPVKIKEIIFIAHSMGGLVTRSACYYAKNENLSWSRKVKKIFFLGTPHLGAPMEKFSNLASGVLNILPLPFTKFSRRILNLRSSGIKDLRFGYVTEDDWKGKNPDSVLLNNKQNIPLQEGVDHYVITGTLMKNPDHPISQWFGDSMVRKPSAQGKSRIKKMSLYFPEENHKEFSGLSHMRLSHTKEIYDQIKAWCS